MYKKSLKKERKLIYSMNKDTNHQQLCVFTVFIYFNQLLAADWFSLERMAVIGLRHCGSSLLIGERR